MPITRFFENFGSAKRTVNIATQSFSADTYNRTLDKGIGAMRIARGLKPNQPDDFEIYSNDSLKSAFTSVADVVRIGAFVISLIALIAAGIGIMNIMLVSVTERTKEIGIRKSIGAKSRDILRQFLTEAVFISEAGGIVGILLGAYLWANMPLSSEWVLGVLLGIQLICEGAALAYLAWMVRTS
jgi:putative ABC transport system permease protein